MVNRLFVQEPSQPDISAVCKYDKRCNTCISVQYILAVVSCVYHKRKFLHCIILYRNTNSNVNFPTFITTDDQVSALG